MRREAYKLAAAQGAGYACLWVDAPLEAALARNADRPVGERVEEATVRHMAERLAPPDPAVHSWEGRFMVRVAAAGGQDQEAEAEAAAVKAAVLACVEDAWRAPGMQLLFCCLIHHLTTRGLNLECLFVFLHPSTRSDHPPRRGAEPR